MSPRAKKDTTPEVVEESAPLAVPNDEGDDQPLVVDHEPVDDSMTSDNGEQFNEFIVALARSAAQQETSALQQRITDLEVIVAQHMHAGAVGKPDSLPRSQVDDVPEYVQSHTRDDGIPWYRGD